jgi:hypothetical protein
MPRSILDRYVSIPYDPGTNTYRYAKLWIIAEPGPRGRRFSGIIRCSRHRTPVHIDLRSEVGAQGWSPELDKSSKEKRNFLIYKATLYGQCVAGGIE